MTGSTQGSDALAAAWRRYASTADQPDWFTRWTLTRTRAVLVHFGDSDLAAAVAALDAALEQPPLAPPAPVDARVDMLPLSLSAELALGVAQRFDNATVLDDVPLDSLQAKRQNPWGGFREAWLEHYNQRIGNTSGE